MFWEGIQYGLILAIMTGPIFFALLHVSVEEGFGAGIMVGTGIWISDLLFILGVSFGMRYAAQVTPEGDFTFWTGIVGGMILIGFGLGVATSKPPNTLFEVTEAHRYSSWLSLFAKGFLINTINPFTFLFWIGISTKVVVSNALNTQATFLFFGGILGMIILTDTLKIYLSKKIRQYMKVRHLLWLRYISGGALVVFGLALMIRVLLL